MGLSMGGVSMGDGAGPAVPTPARGPFRGFGKPQQHHHHPQAAATSCTPLKARVEKIFGGDSDDDSAKDDEGWAGGVDDALLDQAMDQAMTAHEQVGHSTLASSMASTNRPPASPCASEPHGVIARGIRSFSRAHVDRPTCPVSPSTLSTNPRFSHA